MTLHVEVGATVSAGQSLGLLEAMKMEIGFQAPVAGTVKEILVHKGQQVAAGDVILVIEEAADDAGSTRDRVRIGLPVQADPLASLFREKADRPLGVPDLVAADNANLAERRVAIDAAREEIRRVLLGYDVNPDRSDSLAAFLEASIPETISDGFRRELSEIRHELTTFADVEVLTIRAPSASISGQSGPSNSARLRMYVRRVEAEGSGIDEDYLGLVKAALTHYGVPDLTPTDALRRALLRLLTCEAGRSARLVLVLGILRRITALAQLGIFMGDDERLARALHRIARMRPQVTDAVADAALEASYVIFQQPGIEERARRSSGSVERWLAQAEVDLVAPPTGVLLEVASSPRLVFERVGRWIGGEDSNRRVIALAAHVQRRYAPIIPEAYRAVRVDGEPIHCVEYKDRGVVLAATGSPAEAAVWMDRLMRGAESLRERDPETPIVALEYLIPSGAGVDWDALLSQIEDAYRDREFDWRITVGSLTPDGEGDIYRTLVRRNGRLEHAIEHYDLHPETAKRIALDRYVAFDLERLQSEEGIYAFHGRAKNAPGDERIFVLADARDRSPEPGRELYHHLATFERVFNRAARRLRTILQIHDPRRRLQWNRIAIFVAPSIFIEPEVANDIARRLAPATRHLGLEKVVVRLNRLDRARPDDPAAPYELVISDTGEQLELVWREPHDEALLPAQEYERKVVSARHRRLIYPYEIVKMLTSDSPDASGGEGSFEEFDLDPKSPSPVAHQRRGPALRPEQGGGRVRSDPDADREGAGGDAARPRALGSDDGDGRAVGAGMRSPGRGLRPGGVALGAARVGARLVGRQDRDGQRDRESRRDGPRRAPDRDLHAGRRHREHHRPGRQRRRPELLRRARDDADAHEGRPHHDADRVDGVDGARGPRGLGRGVGRGRDRDRRLRADHGSERRGAVLRAQPGRRLPHPLRALPLQLRRSRRERPAAARDPRRAPSLDRDEPARCRATRTVSRRSASSSTTRRIPAASGRSRCGR